ncbi:MAG: peptidylprolyl isomerase [Burkholderiales bacterium]|jgi:peptidyl-prolyl cis-trans isomerase C
MSKLSPLFRLLLPICLAVPLLSQAETLATVNGKEVPKSRADDLIAQFKIQGQSITPELERQVYDEVVLREIFLQEAERQGLNHSEALKAQIELARQSLTINALFNEYKKANPVSDTDIQAAYDSFKAQASTVEYRTRHILVNKESLAKQLIAQLKKGAKFDVLARKYSNDSGSKNKGGDLDYADPKNFISEFSEAMIKLKKGQFTQEPVKSEFGYHIIKLEDSRETPFPALNDVKPQIQKNLEQQRLTQFREELRGNAKTDYTFSK